MNDDARQDAFGQWMAAAGKLDRIVADLARQGRDTQSAMRSFREQEETRFHQAMTAMFRDQQQAMEAALRPNMVRAWQILAVASALFVLVFAGWLLLMKHANDRLRAAQARAEAVEIGAEVQEALKHVEITSCGGRPCIRLDKSTPTWKRGASEYVIVDGK